MSAITTRLLPDAGPKTLAVLRMSAGLATLWFGWLNRGFVIPPEPLRFPPSVSFLPVSQVLFEVAIWVTIGSAVALIAGWRAAAWPACAAVFYAGWVTTVTGKVDHMHHIMWVLVILAVSPCANAWALRRESRGGSYAWPVFAVMVLIGLIYFGAALPKLQSGGWEWAWSDNLVNRMLNMAWEKDQAVRWWLVDYPVVGRIMGVAGLLFELLFLPLIVWPKTRRVVWPAGLAFHWGTWAALGIPFVSLQLMYVVFLPWDAKDRVVDGVITRTQRGAITVIVGVVAVVSVIGVQGGWPFASYPGFDEIADHYVDATTADGRRLAETDAAQLVGTHRLVGLSALSLREGYAADLAAWLGSTSLSVVRVDSTTGEVVSETQVYP